MKHTIETITAEMIELEIKIKAIRSRIILGEYAPGDAFAEATLCKEWDKLKQKRDNLKNK